MGQLQSTFEFGPYRLDARSRELLRDAQHVPLTPKAFDLLMALVAEHGQIVAKDRLMSLVWPGTYIEENNLAVHISTLRKILSFEEPEIEYIKTVAKRGYAFVAPVTSVAKGAHSKRIESVAVLPFQVISSHAGDDYLGPGMSDAIITRLNQISQITVRPTSSVLKYAGLNVDPLECGKDLEVETVLSGRVTRSGDQLRVTVQLIDVVENKVLWADKLDHSFSDVFAYEDFISEHVARALNLRLTGDQIDRLTKPHTDNSAAYWAYLKGRYEWNKRSPGSFAKAIEYFKYASDKDPNYSLAYSGLADCYTLLNYYGATHPKLGMAKAKSAAEKSLEADEGLSEAHASMALVKFWFDWDWSGAEIEFTRSIELNPGYATAHQWYCWFLAAMGRHDESIAEGKRSLDLDSMAPAINMALGKAYFLSRQYDKSIEQCQKTLTLDPNFIPAHYFLGRAYEETGSYTKAVEAHTTAMNLTPGLPLGRTILARAFALNGNESDALEIVNSLLKMSTDSSVYVPAYGISLVYLGLADYHTAVEWLLKAYEEHFIWLAYLNVDPVFDNVREHAGYQRLQELMNFPESVKESRPASGLLLGNQVL
ncbi:MAG TPA: winged helix-turn-helix domain-containing protein [Pyrinomonadaceae bacterium]|nr:winged helix-turn-helix domain-containing protein [Pyrinomonadaceae bacterium]